MHLKQRFLAAVSALGSASAGDVKKCFAVLDQNYTQPIRAYHNWGHIEHCLGELDEAGFDPTLALAIFYHDAIYIPCRKDNEHQSAELLKQHASILKIHRDIAAVAYRLVKCTTHSAPPADEKEALMIDIDLSSLGTDWEQCCKNNKNIRKEYQESSEEIYREGRRAILQMFLKRAETNTLYYSPFFQNKYLVRATQNLRQGLDGLDV